MGVWYSITNLPKNVNVIHCTNQIFLLATIKYSL